MAKISGRNKLPATVKQVVRDGVMAKVVLDGPGGVEITAVITADAADDLGLATGQKVTALIKATEIMVMKD
ncbi:MAG TPA: TOBE domain-containing protein [Thermodesulfobacteriota bacterium]